MHYMPLLPSFYLLTVFNKHVLYKQSLTIRTQFFCTFLDGTKAFERLHYCKLLSKRELPAYTVRVLVNLYTQNSEHVTWGAAISEYFSAV
jgi:hypothetical protein